MSLVLDAMYVWYVHVSFHPMLNGDLSMQPHSSRRVALQCNWKFSLPFSILVLHSFFFVGCLPASDYYDQPSIMLK